MATKQVQDVSSETVEELLDVVDKTLDRVKTLYEQYFLGIQKQAPAFLHNDVERKLRDLTQLQLRNTGLRYRLATLTQKFGSYNAYWRRTLRQIENGKYIRNLSKIGREAIRTGSEIPEEILAAMPKRMREQVLRDREQALAIARRKLDDEPDTDEQPALSPEPPAPGDVAAMTSEPSALRRDLKTASGAHVVSDADGDFDLDAFFAAVQQEPDPAPSPPPPPIAPGTGPRPVVPQPARPSSVGPSPPRMPSQISRPNPIVAGAAASRGNVGVESMSGPFPRIPPASGPAASQPPAPPPRVPKPPPRPEPVRQKPPPGMTDADVNALYAKYVKAKELIGEPVGPGGFGKLMKTINAQAPKIMEQYKAKSVDFSVVVKDNQVIIRAKPKT